MAGDASTVSSHRTIWLAERVVRGVLARCVATLYPPCCIACTRAVDAPHGLCAHCWRELSFIERPYCERLGLPFALDLSSPLQGPLLSPAALAFPPAFARARAAVRFEGRARSLVHQLKFNDRMDFALPLGRMMAHAGRDLLSDAHCLVAVPLHRRRLWQRRFNQSMVLADCISRITGIPVALDLIERAKRTRPQIRLSRSERDHNLKGAFRVPLSARAHVKGQRIVLIDDVLTTGATVNAAARCLLRAGAARVDVLTFACVTLEAGF